MSVIRLLEKSVAELIAAGEVVDCPASVVKELVENAIDAGATAVTVEIQNGGVKYIRVTDNGSGIPRDQVPTAFLRHATSKVSQAEDLAGIHTLGFRGEALASIGAVCRVEMLTRTKEEETGTRYRIEGGEEICCEDAGCPVGTTILVRDIFYNTPARMKFLKKDVSEGNLVAAAVDRAALSHPELSMRFVRDGEQKLMTPGDNRLQSAILAVYGREFVSSLLPVDFSSRGLRLRGYISKPERSRASRTMQTFYINQRYMRSRTCAAALDEAYKHTTMVGKFPACVLDIEMPPAAVDVNVHPAKIEVRFADEKAIFDLVYYGCRQALEHLGQNTAAADRGFARRTGVNAYNAGHPATQGAQERFTAQQYRQMVKLPPAPSAEKETPPPARPRSLSRPAASPSWEEEPEIVVPRPSLAFSPARGEKGSRVLRDEGTQALPPLSREQEARPPVPQRADGPGESPAAARQEPTKAASLPEKAPSPGEATPSRPEEAPSRQEAAQPDYQVVGELMNTYILLDGGESLVLVDKHAAHERLLYEELKKHTDLSRSQVLLAPVPVTLSKELYGAAVNNLEAFARLGFGVEDFGDGMLLVREVPVLLEQQDTATVVEEIAGKLAAHRRDLTPQLLDELFHSVACRSAVKAGSRSQPQEQEAIVRLLRENPTLRNCPHGRPVAVEITRREIEKLFGRIV